jgi:hypothetical protein
MLFREKAMGQVTRLAGTILLLCCASCSDPEEEKVTEPSPPAPIEVANSEKLATIPLRSGIVENWRRQADDPTTDGWDSEVLVAAAQGQLDLLGELLIEADRESSIASIRELLTGDESLSPLVPAGLGRVYEDGLVTVDRFPQEPAWSKPTGGLVGALAGTGPGRAGSGARSKFKITRVLPGQIEKSFITHQLVSLTWRTEVAVVEQHATWEVQWQQGDGDGPPLIQRLGVGKFEQTRTSLVEGRTLFSDCTESVLGANPSYREQLLFGLNHWLSRLPYRVPLNFSGSPGLALGDVNGDGLEDLYLCQEPGLPNRLYLQKSDGTLRDVSEAWGVDWIEDSRGALMVDFDNDGDQDLAVAISGGVVLASNEGSSFRRRTVLATSRSTTSLAAADFDRDGRLDLYVCAYAPNSSLNDPGQVGALPNRFVYHDSNDGASNSLFHNRTEDRGTWAFTDVTKEVGLDLNNRRWSFAAAWEDFDNDGDQDLYVANDFGRNNLYRNDSVQGALSFVDVAGATGTEDSASGMSVSWGDCDRDGRMDLYVSNMFSAAGSRITPQAKFKPGMDETLRGRFQHFARGNTLLGNKGKEGFGDLSVSAGVTMGRWAWGSNFADLNNDGWEDLIVANGYVTTDDERDL